MLKYDSALDVSSVQAQEQTDFMTGLVRDWRAIEARAVQASESSRAAFINRDALMPRERLGALLDPASPFLPLANMAGYLMDDPDPATSVPGDPRSQGSVLSLAYVAWWW